METVVSHTFIVFGEHHRAKCFGVSMAAESKWRGYRWRGFGFNVALDLESFEDKENKRFKVDQETLAFVEKADR